VVEKADQVVAVKVDLVAAEKAQVAVAAAKVQATVAVGQAALATRLGVVVAMHLPSRRA
jgi:hypothetical protein